MITWIFQGLAWLVVGGLVLQFYAAGTALFGATTFQFHRMLGDGLAAAMLLLFLVGLIARPGRRVVVASVGLAALAVVQVVLPSLRSGLPWVAALHVVNAVALASLAMSIALASRPGSRALAAGRSVAQVTPEAAA